MPSGSTLWGPDFTVSVSLVLPLGQKLGEFTFLLEARGCATAWFALFKFC